MVEEGKVTAPAPAKWSVMLGCQSTHVGVLLLRRWRRGADWSFSSSQLLDDLGNYNDPSSLPLTTPRGILPQTMHSLKLRIPPTHSCAEM